MYSLKFCVVCLTAERLGFKEYAEVEEVLEYLRDDKDRDVRLFASPLAPESET